MYSLQPCNILGKHCCVSLRGGETEVQEGRALSKDTDLALCNNQIKTRTSGFSACHGSLGNLPVQCIVLTSWLLGRVQCSKRSHKPKLFPRLSTADCPCELSVLSKLSSAFLSVKQMNVSKSVLFLSPVPSSGSGPFPNLLQKGRLLGTWWLVLTPLKDFRKFPSLVISQGKNHKLDGTVVVGLGVSLFLFSQYASWNNYETIFLTR